MKISDEQIANITVVEVLPNLADVARDEELNRLKGQLYKECNEFLRKRLREIRT